MSRATLWSPLCEVDPTRGSGEGLGGRKVQEWVGYGRHDRTLRWAGRTLTDTSVGIIHYAADGSVHIVAARRFS